MRASASTNSNMPEPTLRSTGRVPVAEPDLTRHLRAGTRPRQLTSAVANRGQQHLGVAVLDHVGRRPFAARVGGEVR